ncbi:MAG: M28 family peptidase [Bryobacterales bacterium]|nr:M28 family peptidase [Bryobacterales bacterium]
MRRIGLLGLAAAMAALGQDYTAITPAGLASHVEFLASDALGGRDTPSPGLDAAAAYLHAQFRRIGLETPGGAASYYQTANWRYRQTPLDEVRFSFKGEGAELSYTGNRFRIYQNGAVAAENAPVYKLAFDSLEELKTLKDGALEGKIALGIFPGPAELRKMAADERRKFFGRSRDFAAEIGRLRPEAVLSVMPRAGGTASADGELIGADKPPARLAQRPFTRVFSDELVAAWKAMPFGDTKAVASLKIPEPVEQNIALHNVIGVLPGSDPVLRDSYVIVSAHYDHIGRGGDGADSIFNGANDDASGTASLLGIAEALARSPRPKRSVVFLALFGEEKGLLGAYYYARNPAFPVDKTVGNINLEHLGRTDDSEGARVNGVSVTGYDFSNLPAHMGEAAKTFGVSLTKHPEHSDDFFARSDNLAFAEVGIPAHTFCVAFEFPDYHGLRDHWDKLDYENMTNVTRALAAGIVAVADDAQAPAWDKDNPRTEKYRTSKKTE